MLQTRTGRGIHQVKLLAQLARGAMEAAGTRAITIFQYQIVPMLRMIGPGGTLKAALVSLGLRRKVLVENDQMVLFEIFIQGMV